jgi:hypothetical protein
LRSTGSGAIVPGPEVGLQVGDLRAQIPRHRGDEVGKRAGASLDVERRQLGAHAEQFGVEAGIELRAACPQLGADLLADLLRVRLGDEGVVGAPV